MSAMDEATVRKVAALARLTLTDDEAARASGELTRILDWVEQLGEVDVDGVDPMAGGSPDEGAHLRRRVDAVTDGGARDAVLANAPKAAQGFFVVPKVVE